MIDPLKWRYAVKKFDPEQKLSDNQIEHLKASFNLTATSYGLQPIRLLVIQNKAIQEKLVAHSYGQRQVADASHLLILCVETNIDSRFIESHFKRVADIRGTSEEILNPFKQLLIQRFNKMSADQIRRWAVNQAYLALGKLLAVCAYAQIDSCPMEGFDSEAYDKVLQLNEKGLTSVLVFPVGVRAADDKFATFKKVRRAEEDVVLTLTENEFL